MKYLNLYNCPNERTTITYPYVWWDGAFTNDDLKNITDYCDAQGFERAKVLGTDDKEETESIRRCDIKFYGKNETTAWIFDKLNGVINALNAQFYGFDLNGYENFQYTSYNSAEQGEYGWHMDMCMDSSVPDNMPEPRKLSLTLLLNEPGVDFEGGDFEINDGRPRKIEIPKGRVIAFPSFMLHRVTPVTKGYRKSAVVWVTGPKFA